jgi:predicted metal-dependent HD superfamily phosphohydrolase
MLVYDIDELSRRWQQCWSDRYSFGDTTRSIDHQTIAQSNQREIDRVFRLLVAAYTTPDRSYHNLNHIHHVLTILDRFTVNNSESSPETLLQNPVPVVFAAWFHDFVYDSQSADNELQSAKSATELLANIGISTESIDRVQQLILATKGHQIDPDDLDRCIFLDADLAILGADPIRYQAYQQSIRHEYSWVSDSEYRVGRIGVLESFLQRDRLYCTDLLFTELESIARNNIKHEIDRLIIS